MLLTSKQLAGHVAHWAVRLSPYPVPDDLSSVLQILQHNTSHLFPAPVGIWDCSPKSLQKALKEILLPIITMAGWGDPKDGSKPDFVVVSPFDLPRDPDASSIDLDALVQDVVMSICREEGQAFPWAIVSIPKGGPVVTMEDNLANDDGVPPTTPDEDKFT